eukprot:COSAG05_NODE_1339_length_5145_cov_5.141102_4_plen_89_part_00
MSDCCSVAPHVFNDSVKRPHITLRLQPPPPRALPVVSLHAATPALHATPPTGTPARAVVNLCCDKLSSPGSDYKMNGNVAGPFSPKLR